MPDKAEDLPQDGWERCTLCGRLVPVELITKHHLKPRERGGKAEDRRLLCRPCHKQLHAVFSNAELAGSYSSIESLRNAPRLQGFLKWIRRQKPGRNFRTVTSSSHPRLHRRGRRR